MANPDSDVRHWRFVYESLHEMQLKLKDKNAVLYIFHNEVEMVLNELQKKYEIKSIFSHMEVGNRITYDRDISTPMHKRRQIMSAKTAVLFIGKKSRTTRHWQLPVYLRVSIDNKRFEVATHRHVDLLQWSPSSGLVKSKSDNAIETNMALEMASKKVYDYGDELYKENRNFTVKFSSRKMVWPG